MTNKRYFSLKEISNEKKTKNSSKHIQKFTNNCLIIPNNNSLK